PVCDPRFICIWLGHFCSFPEVLYPQSRSSRYLQTLGFFHPFRCPIIADVLQSAGRLEPERTDVEEFELRVALDDLDVA
ncbi:MAG: hypothetical protein QF543_05010, partial [Dehalococcoidales bacterium]|nr:hypothetical protein [Dehalococcoidales bacterium]